MTSRGLLLAIILGAASTACALDSAGTIVGESTGSGAAAASSGGSAPGGSGSGASGAAGSGGSPSTSSSSGPAVGGGGGGTCAGGSVCVPSAESYALVLPGDRACPPGWQGPSDFASSALDPGCSACSCGDPTGGTCSPGSVSFTGNCNNLHETGDAPSCHNTVENYDQVVAEAPTPQGGSCPASGGGKAPLDQQRVCNSAPNGACDTGSCVPEAPEGELCLVSSDGSCPGGYATRTLFPILADERDCSCLCDAPEAECTGATVGVYDSNDCRGTVVTITANGSCTNPMGVGFIESWQFLTEGTWTAQTCSPNLQAGGPVTFGDGVVLCCPG